MNEKRPVSGHIPESYLLDTHTALWALDSPETLSPSARKAASTGPNVLSVASYWEVVIKSMKGTLDVGDPRLWWQEALQQLAATVLPLRPDHIAAVLNLPPIHKDPFDRVLIAQATVEGLTLVSRDAAVTGYASADLRIIR
ncbi:MAG: type II toxin-antitoxin system VapC family toxin [Terracidiphilus sp.]